MRIGLMADTHDRLPAIAELLRRMALANVGMVLHAGDFCAPFALGPFHDSNMALAGVFGRNDGDREGLKAYAAKGLGTEIYESPHSMEVGGQRLLLVHDISDVSHRSIEAHTVVVHGCSHRVEMKTRGDSLIINPGEACGWIYGEPTAVVLDLETKSVEVFKLTGTDWRQ